ncbi:MAG: PKD domain-containing protein, partial [Anaerolineae bacterium]|nr:PKD domain-containing protein [Anaerolineae bacterium]
MRFRVLILGLLAFILLGVEVPVSNAQSDDAWSLQVLESDAQHIVLELWLPGFEQEAVLHDGNIYQKIQVTGGISNTSSLSTFTEWILWGQPGQPQLPMQSIPLGMSEMGIPQITVLEAKNELVRDILVYPAPAMTLEEGSEELQGEPCVVETFALDALAYTVDTFSPDMVAEAVDIGFLRDQPMFQLRLYPFQYNPQQRMLRVYHYLKVLVTFPVGGQPAGSWQAQPPAFEQIAARALLNYDVLPAPSLGQASDSSRVPQAPSVQGSQVKLKIEHSGLYRVTYADLSGVAPGLLSTDPRTWEVLNQGLPVAIYVEGEADGTFGADDSLLFYGQAIEDQYTRYNVYWLRAGSGAGLRMAERDGTPTDNPSPGMFSNQHHYEENLLYWRTVPDGQDKDHWFWEEVSVSGGTPVISTHTFDLYHIAADGPPGELRLLLHGYTSGEHLTQVCLNDTPLLSATEQAWEGRVEHLYQIPVTQTLFLEGTNVLQIEARLPAGSSISAFDVNWFEVAYQDTFVAEDNVLAFSASAGAYTFEVDGFTADDIGVFDVTDPLAPVRIINSVVDSENGGVTFDDDVTHDSEYIAQAVSQIPSPDLLELDASSAWASPANGATYVIITHPNFYNAVQPLAEYRRSQGETVVTVKTEDLYDEFNAGIFGPEGIRSFLEYAYLHWSPRLVYVVLVGDSSLDSKKYLSSSYTDLLPVYHTEVPLFGQAPNDSEYAKVYGDDDYPDLIVGRITARYTSDVATVVSKIQAYEQSPSPGEWLRRAILVADDNDPGFAMDMDMVGDLLPSHIIATKMYAYNPDTNVQIEVSAGALLLAYSGHASGTASTWGKWGDQIIFNQSQIQALLNGYRLPFVTVANCLNGWFNLYYRSRAMAEEFLLSSNRGAIASWAPASYGYPTPNTVILDELYQALMVDRDFVLGSAVTTARLQSHLRRPDLALSLFEVFTYFGDPAVRLHFPPQLALAGQSAPEPATMGDLLTYTLVYTVSDGDIARGLTLVDTLPDGMMYQSAQPAPSSVYARTLTWNLGNIPVGVYTITVTARVTTNGLAHGQVLYNQAHVYDANGGDQYIQIASTVHDSSILDLVANNDGPVEVGTLVTLLAEVAAGTNVVYAWNLGDGSPVQSGSTIQYTYPNVGAYTARVMATNGVSIQSATTEVVIGDVPPTAQFDSSSPDLRGQPTVLHSTSTGTNLSYLWDLGDGSLLLNTSVPTVTYVYVAPGQYTVVLTASNSAGYSVASGTVEILNRPGAGFSTSSPDRLGQATIFTNTSTTGGDTAQNMLYAWDFGDGVSSVVRSPVHTYSTVGEYIVTLTVYNRVASDMYSATVTVTDVPVTGLSARNDSPTMLGEVTVLTATVA